MWYKASKKNDSETTTENQLNGLRGKDSETKNTQEKQLEEYRSEIPTQTTEKQLDSSLRKDASKKDKADKPTEQMLKDLKSPRPEPTIITENQLDDYHFDIPSELTENQLDSSRKNSPKDSGLVEGRLNESKGGLVKHRNEDAHKGNINKLEELRLSGKKTQEKEKAELSSETPKDMRFDKKPSGDGLRLAQAIPGDDAFNVPPAEEQEPFEVPSEVFATEEEENEDDGGDEDSFVLVEKENPKIDDSTGTKIQSGIISFVLSDFAGEDGNLDKPLLEQKVGDYLAEKYSIKTPRFGTVKILVNEQRGSIGYFSPVP